MVGDFHARVPCRVLREKPIGPQRLDRLSLSAWALVRQPTAVVIDPRAPATAPVSLASGGQLGGSRAGARLTYRVNHALAANLRVSAPMNPKTQKRIAGEMRLPCWRKAACTTGACRGACA